MTGRRVVLGFVLASALAACGGSASETPPPLEPDPRGFHYGSPVAARDTSDAGDAPTKVDDSQDDDQPRKPAHSTWGSNAGKSP